jgi:hypothetical protein
MLFKKKSFLGAFAKLRKVTLSFVMCVRMEQLGPRPRPRPHWTDFHKSSLLAVISGFRRDVAEICALLGYYTALSDSFIPTFRENISMPSSRIN